ncbi:hypothetical protein FRC02_005366, partial [Tulasnella sp. 418]
MTTPPQEEISTSLEIMDDPLPPPLEGKLEPEKRVAEGSYSEIWRGKWWPPDSSESKDVAIKLLRLINLSSDSDKELIEKYARLNKRLRREARAHVIEGHPRLVPLIGYRPGERTYWNPPCLVTPWYSNGDLRDYLCANPEADKFKIVLQVAEGLVHLHGIGTIHGDLRPENILVDDDGNALIGDFGLSQIRRANRNDNTSGPLTGHPYYCAPEVWSSHRTFKSDVFAFGGNLLTIMSGSSPFWMYRGSKKWRIRDAIHNGIFPSQEDHENVDEWMWQLMYWCWQVNPDDRPTMVEVFEWLQTSN